MYIWIPHAYWYQEKGARYPCSGITEGCKHHVKLHNETRVQEEQPELSPRAISPAPYVSFKRNSSHQNPKLSHHRAASAAQLRIRHQLPDPRSSIYCLLGFWKQLLCVTPLQIHRWIKLQFSNVWYLSNAPPHSRANNCRSLGHASLLCLCHFRLCSKGGKSACFHPRKWGSKHRSFDCWSFLRKTMIQSQEKVSDIPTKMLCFLRIWNGKLSVCIFLLRV